MEEVYNLWNDTDFNNYITNRPNIFLNLTKDGTVALPTVRINKLLSHRCIIISEHTNNADEEYYKDMIYFCDLSSIGSVYEKLINKSNDELVEESNRIYEKFYDTFHFKNALDIVEIKHI